MTDPDQEPTHTPTWRLQTLDIIDQLVLGMEPEEQRHLLRNVLACVTYDDLANFLTYSTWIILDKKKWRTKYLKPSVQQCGDEESPPKPISKTSKADLIYAATARCTCGSRLVRIRPSSPGYYTDHDPNYFVCSTALLANDFSDNDHTCAPVVSTKSETDPPARPLATPPTFAFLKRWLHQP